MSRTLPPFLKQYFLDKTLRALSLRKAIAIEKDRSLRDVLRVYVEQKIGSVIVLNEGALCGIVTERDFVRKLKPFSTDGRTLESIMTPDPVALPPSASIARALHTFAVEGFRHIPVTGTTLHLCSVRDILDYVYNSLGKPILAGNVDFDTNADSRSVREFFETPVEVLNPAAPKRIDHDSSAEEALDLMRKYNIGSLIVGNTPGQVVGIVTERDLISRVLFPARAPADVRVGELMTPNPETILATSSFSRALDFMFSGRFRHLPVVDHSERLVGVISVKDIARRLAESILEDLRTTGC